MTRVKMGLVAALASSLALLGGLGAVAVARAGSTSRTVNVPCSSAALVSAIRAADDEGGGQLLLSSNCTYRLEAPYKAIDGDNGLPALSADIAIVGGRSTRIQRSPSAPDFRLIEITHAADVTIENVFIAGGLLSGAESRGGGIYNEGYLRLDHVTIENDSAGSGGGVFNGGTARFEYTLVTANSAGAGGGAFNRGTAAIDSCIFRNDHADSGGGIYDAERLSLDNSTLSRNVAGDRGGDRADRSRASDTRGEGGGLYVEGEGRATLTRSLVSENRAAGRGGGIFAAGPRVTLPQSLIKSNLPDNCYPSELCLRASTAGAPPATGPDDDHEGRVGAEKG